MADWLWRLLAVLYLVVAACVTSVAMDIARWFGLGQIDWVIGIGVLLGCAALGDAIERSYFPKPGSR